LNSGQIGLGKRYESFGGFVFGKKNRFGKQHGSAGTKGIASTFPASARFGTIRFLFLRAKRRVHFRCLVRPTSGFDPANLRSCDGVQGSDPMKLKVKIPPKQRPIMFLMFGLGLVFPWVFVGLANFHADTRYRSTSNKSRFLSNTVFHGVAFIGGLNDVQDTAGKSQSSRHIPCAVHLLLSALSFKLPAGAVRLATFCESEKRVFLGRLRLRKLPCPSLLVQPHSTKSHSAPAVERSSGIDTACQIVIL